VIEKFSNVIYPTRTCTNYTEWSPVMKVNLQAVGLWDMIESDASDYREDRSALAAILRAVLLEMQAGLAVKSTTHEAWEAIRKVRLGVDRVKEANAERFQWEFDEISFKSGESVEDFSLRLNTVASQLRVLGDNITDKEVIKRMLHSIPEKLEQVTISMETLLNLDSLLIEEVVGHLWVVEQRKKPPAPKENGGRLLLTEEWLARMKIREGSSSNSRARRGGTSGGNSKNKGGKQGTGGARKSKAGHDDVCGYCGKKSHWATECHKKKCDKETQPRGPRGGGRTEIAPGRHAPSCANYSRANCTCVESHCANHTTTLRCSPGGAKGVR
jgi:uncharacterized membrane protein YgcG